jgi:hypothetical protein
MQKWTFQISLPHIIAVLIFLIVAVVFCSPVLQGKVLSQSDIMHWKGMAQQSFEFKEKYGHFPLWTNSMFGGMPAYHIAMEPDIPITAGFFHNIFTLFLPKPISFFFLACISFYFLCQVFRINPWISILGGLAYAYATYDPVIVAVGHDTKMLSLGYVPALLGALVLLYEKKYWLGGALTALFSFLLVGMNHLQIMYYFFIMAGFMTIGYIIKWVKEKNFKHLFLALSIALVAGLTGVLGNAVNMFVTYDYSKATMRNGTLSLDTTNTSGSKKAGLPIDYAFNWSYGKTETFTLLFPAIYGGSNSPELKEGSSIAKKLSSIGVPEEQAEQFAQSLSFTYWGAQPFTQGTVYLGAIICFLFIFGIIYLKTWHRWWILAACILAILLSWGKNFEAFNTFLFNYLPLYNKFRAPTMSLVIPQLCFALTGVMVLQRVFFGLDTSAEKWKKLKLAGYITGGVLLIGVLLYFSFDYKGLNDESIKQQLAQATQNEQTGNEVYSALRDDRQSLFGGDLLRSIILIALSFGLLFLFIRNKIKFGWAIGGLLLLNAYDLIGVGKRYLNETSFVEPDQFDAAFTPTNANLQIKQDTGQYRVLNLTADVFNDAITSYHHNAVGGYHPAKLSIYEDLLTFHLRKQPMNINVLNMLNTKYVITADEKTQQQVVQQNPAALGNAWFVNNIQFEKGPLSMMKALDTFNPQDVAIIDEADKSLIPNMPQPDSAGNIQLINSLNDEIIYKSASGVNGFAVFSEVFYDRGWKAYIDEKESPIIRTNYALRGLSIPAGNHEIKFIFHPESYYTGTTIATIANIVILMCLIIAAFMVYKRRAYKPQNG